MLLMKGSDDFGEKVFAGKPNVVKECVKWICDRFQDIDDKVECCKELVNG